MVKEQNEARVYVAKTIEFIDRNKPQELIDVNWGLRKDRNSGLRSQETLLFLADNAIDAHNEYLWSRADDPAVIEAVAEAMWTIGREDWEAWEVLPEEWREDHRAKAHAAITVTLTELIGGRKETTDATN